MLAVLIGVGIIHFALTHDSRTFPKKHEINGFHFVAQPDEITCGPTSALMLLERYGKDPDIDDVEKQTKTRWFTLKGRPIGMTAPEYIKSALNHFGVDSKVKTGSLTTLKQQVGNDTPVIVLVRSGKAEWHYVVVIGYSETEIITADPSGGCRKRMNLKAFEGCWKFETDMEGNSVHEPCAACKGTGWRWDQLGICQECEGKGYTPDLLSQALRFAEVYSNTMIVPTSPVQKEK